MLDAKLAAAAVASVDVAIVVVDIDGNVTLWNPAAETLFGYAAGEALGRFAGDLIIPPDAVEDWNRRRRLLGSDSMFRDVVRRRRRDGSEFAAEMAIAPMHDDTGKTVGVVASFCEAMSATAAEGSREQAGIERALLARAVDTSPLYVLAWDTEGVVVLARGAGAPGQLRFAPHLVGRSMFDIYDDSTGLPDAVRATLAGEDGETVVRYGPRQLQVAFRTMRTDDGTLVGGVASGIDITELVATTDALRRAETRTRAVLQHVSEIILLASADTTLVEAIIGDSGGFGYTADQVVGRVGWEFVHPDDLSRVQEMVEELLTEPGGRRHQVTFRILQADGTWGWAEETVTNALHEPDIGAIIVNLRDITERVAMQQRMNDMERLEALGGFASGVAHDFNNVLSTIRGHAELLLEQSQEQPSNSSDAEAIVRGVDRAAAMVEQLIAFARGRNLRLESTDVNDVVADAIEFIGTGSHRLVDIRFQRGVAATADLDPGQMQRALVNLLSNSCDAAAQTIDVVVDVVGRRVEIRVTDDGKGMTDEELARCFEPFFTTKGARGTGLGLATANAIVTQNGGDIAAASEPGTGTTFIVTIPAGEV